LCRRGERNKEIESLRKPAPRGGLHLECVRGGRKILPRRRKEEIQGEEREIKGCSKEKIEETSVGTAKNHPWGSVAKPSSSLKISILLHRQHKSDGTAVKSLPKDKKKEKSRAQEGWRKKVVTAAINGSLLVLESCHLRKL